MSTVCNECYADCSDEVLLHAMMQKDMRAFEALYNRHAPVVYNLLLQIVHNESLAEELLQDTFWQVWQKIDQHTRIGAGVAWMHQIARHKALDQLRPRKQNHLCGKMTLSYALGCPCYTNQAPNVNLNKVGCANRCVKPWSRFPKNRGSVWNWPTLKG